MINISKVNESFLKITGDFDDTRSISEYFTRHAPNYIWNPRYKAGIWDGKIRLFNLVNGHLPYGLKHMLDDCIDKNSLEYEDNITPYPFVLSKDIFESVVKSFNKFNPHEHQIRGAWQAISKGRGLLEHATSSGKTLTLYFILSYFLNITTNEKIIVVVPNKSLIKQFCSNFEEYGMDSNLIGRYYGDEKDLTKRITVGTWQSLKNVPDFLESVSIAFGDEIHHAKATEIKSLFENCVNAYVRIGVTGSLPKNECDLLSIVGSFGPILEKVKTDELIKKNIVSPVDIIQINYYYPKEIKKQCRGDYRLEKTVIQTDLRRKLMVKSLIGKQRKGDNILLLFDELEFGKDYYDYLSLNFPDKKFRYVSGDVSADEREEIRKFTNENEDVVIVASLGTYSTGIDIPRLHAIIFLWMGKSDIRLKQSIGRGLRRHVSKDKMVIYDICDQLKYSKSHATERLRIYMSEGYPVKSIEVGKS